MAVSRLQQKAEAEISGFNHGYGLVLLILSVIIAGIFWWQLPPQIPLFYGLTYGTSQLANRGWFLLLPGLALISYGVSHFLARRPVRSKLFPAMMGWLQTLCMFLIILAMVHIIMVAL